MNHTTYHYTIDEAVPIKEVELSLMLAVLATECIHGHSQVRLDASFSLDPKNRSCRIDATSEVGQTIARIFTGFLTKEFGEQSFNVARIGNIGSIVRESIKAL